MAIINMGQQGGIGHAGKVLIENKDEFLPKGITPMVLLHKASEAVEEQHSSVIDVLFLVQPMDPMETQDL